MLPVDSDSGILCKKKSESIPKPDIRLLVLFAFGTFHDLDL